MAHLKMMAEQCDGLFSILPVGVFVYGIRPDGSFSLEYVSSRWCDIHRVTREEAFSDGFVETSLVHPEEREAFLDHNREARERREPFSWEGRFLIGGETHWLRIQSRPEGGEDELINWVGVTEDITSRKRAKQEQERLQARLHLAQRMDLMRRLARGVAHDFNNALTLILGQTEMALMDADPSQPVYQTLMQIKKGGKRSVEIIRQALGFTQNLPVVPEVLNLNDTVAGMLKMLGKLSGEGIELKWAPGTDLWTVKMDPSQIERVLAVLCLNAGEAITGPGKIVIETRNIVTEPGVFKDDTDRSGAPYVLLSVSDNGCGMDKEVLENIFEPFFTTKDPGKGEGLGLAIVYGIATQNNGWVDAHSEPGEGTTFNIYLPRYIDTETAVAEQETEEPLGRGYETILLVEGEPILLNLEKDMLEMLGYRVLPAAMPADAIKAAQEFPDAIHLLIADFILPEMTGHELAERILPLYPNLKSLFMSGYTADTLTRRGALEGGTPYIQKPFDLKGLGKKVREALERP